MQRPKQAMRQNMCMNICPLSNQTLNNQIIDNSQLGAMHEL